MLSNGCAAVDGSWGCCRSFLPSGTTLSLRRNDEWAQCRNDEWAQCWCSSGTLRLIVGTWAKADQFFKQSDRFVVLFFLIQTLDEFLNPGKNEE